MPTDPGSITELVELAQQVLNGASVLQAARRIMELQQHVDPSQSDPDLLFFSVVASETDSLPVGTERDLWDRDALAERDQQIRQAETLYREHVTAACHAIIRRYGRS